MKKTDSRDLIAQESVNRITQKLVDAVASGELRLRAVVEGEEQEQEQGKPGAIRCCMRKFALMWIDYACRWN